jgi:hypothetical protein
MTLVSALGELIKITGIAYVLPERLEGSGFSFL